jgi:hypothetical protein
VIRNERYGDAIASKVSQREERLETGDAGADDDNMAGGGGVGLCHGLTRGCWRLRSQRALQ